MKTILLTHYALVSAVSATETDHSEELSTREHT